MYQKVFGKNQNFTIELEYDGTNKVISPSNGRYYSFKRLPEDLIVYEEESYNHQIV